MEVHLRRRTSLPIFSNVWSFSISDRYSKRRFPNGFEAESGCSLQINQVTFWTTPTPGNRNYTDLSCLFSRLLSSMNGDGDRFSALEKYRVESLPHALYYITNFLSPEEELSLLDKVVSKYGKELTCRYLTRNGSNSLIDDFNLIHRH